MGHCSVTNNLPGLQSITAKSSKSPLATTDDLKRKQRISPRDETLTLSTRAALSPIKAPTNVRTVTVVDFQPDVCKDYKKRQVSVGLVTVGKCTTSIRFHCQSILH